MKIAKQLIFPVIGGLYAALFALELNPTLYGIVHDFIEPTRENLLLRAVLVWSLASLGLAFIYILFKGNWRQLIFVVIVYFIVYYLDGILWFNEQKRLIDTGLHQRANYFSREFYVQDYSNFFEYDRFHVSGSNFYYFTYKSLCFLILFSVPFALSRGYNFIFRKNQFETEVIDD